jgi:hypothetical protein
MSGTNTFLWCMLFMFISWAFSGCSDNNNSTTIEVAELKGVAQKGPFLVGTSITINELDQQFNQTGNSFSAQIDDNSGNFQISNLTLASNYVLLQAQGFYFNEICGNNSGSQITLNCICDVSVNSDVHINLLTHLEKSRVEYLIANGTAFSDAKVQAQQEVLKIFNVDLVSIQNSEFLNIAQSGDGNAALLAVTAILQAFRTESELSSMLTQIGNDLRSDGDLDDITIQSSLIDQALHLDTIVIRNNLTGFYSNLGVSATIPHFEKYLGNFINNTTFQPTNALYSFPVTGPNGDNVLFKNTLQYSGNSLNASMNGQAKHCSFLKFRMQVISGAQFGNLIGANINLSISNYNNTTQDQWFTVVDPGLPFEHKLAFNGAPSGGGGTYLLEYYEKDSTTPTFTKVFSVSP